jgi:autotransporter-associated beta strand protein
MRLPYKNFITCIAMLCVLTVTNAQSFVHPGLLHTQDAFDRMRTKVAANAQPWKGSWDILVANSHSSLTRPIATVPSVIYRGFDGTHAENYASLFRDAASAYATALRWQISGDTAYANKSIAILNAWSAGLTTISGTSDKFLLAGIQGYQLANAAEIMRMYSGWTATDLNRFKNWMLTVFYSMNKDFLTNHNGSCISHYWANWDLCNLASMLSIGVLCDRRDIYDDAINYYKTGAGNGAIQKMVPYVHGELAQYQESGRDQGHTVLGVALAGSICEMAWNQGEDLYGYDNNRLLKAFEYIAKYNLGYDVPYTTYSNCDGIVQTIVSPDGRGNIRPVWELVYNHYVHRKGLAALWCSLFAQRVRPEGGGGNYGPNSGGYDQLGYGTLTFSQDVPAKPNDQTITFPPIPAKDFGAPDFDPGAVASSGLPVVYSSSNPAVAGIDADGTIRVLQPGTAIIYAQQLGNDVYNAAPVAQQSITVNKIPGTNDGAWSNTTGTTTNAIASVSGSADLTWPGQSFVVGDPVRLTGTVPGGFSTNTSYTVVAVQGAENKIQLALQPGGPAVVATTTISNGTAMRFQKWLVATNWTGGVIPGGIQSTATFGAGSFSNIAGVTLDSNITIGMLNYASNGSSELHLANGLNNGRLTFATVVGTPRITMFNTGSRKLFLGNAINNARVPLTIAGTQGLAINTPVYGGGNPAGLRIQAAIDWSAFSGGIFFEQGTIELHNTTNSSTAADNVLLPPQRLTMGTQNTAVLIFTGAGNVASKQTIGALDGTNAAYIIARPAITNGIATLVVGADNQNGEYEGFIGMGPVTDLASDKGRIHLEKTGTGTQIISGIIKNGTTVINGASFFSTVAVSNGKLVLNGVNEYEGGTTVNGGELEINGVVVSKVVVNAGTLSGTGVINDSMVLGREAGYSLQYNSEAFHKITTADAIINNATLTLTDNGDGAFIGHGKRFVIIDNAGNNPVSGQFAGLPEGGVIRNGVNAFTISYTGGNGNDVELVANMVKLSVQYKDGDSQLTNNTAKPYLKIINDDSVAIAYSSLTMRYWLTAENYAGINTWIDYAQLGSNAINMKYVQLAQPHQGAFGYIEYSFDASAGMLAGHSNSGIIQSRFANTNWAALNESDDYSYGVNEHITLYIDGILIYGTEPAETLVVTKVKVLYANNNQRSNSNTIRAQIKVSNEGNVPLDYKDLSVRYWFSSEGAACNYWIDYAQISITGQFADGWFELKADSTSGQLYPLSNTGTIQYRIAKTNWSNFDETNDYSWLPSTTYTENDHITVYYKGELIYGTEPAINGTITAAATRTTNTAIYPNPVTGNRFYVKGTGFVKLYSLDGKLLFNKKAQAGVININLPSGLYLVQVNDGPAAKLVIIK